MLAGSAAVAVLLGGCDGGSVPVLPPTPTPVPGGWTCPGGDLLIEGPAGARAVTDALLTTYAETCRNKARIINESTSSEQATTSFVNGLVNVAITDIPTLSESNQRQAQRRCSDSEVWHLPMMVSPIALQYNVPELEGLKLTPTVLAQIFTGAIDTWDDPAIARLNPDADLPDEKIQVFFSSGNDGTTEAVNRWLSATAPKWWPANSATSSWRGKGEAKNSADEIASSLRSTDYSIGYIDVAAASRRPNEVRLPYAQIDNGHGPVLLSSSSVRKALEGATVPTDNNNLIVAQNYTDLGPDAYPLSKVTYFETCARSQPPDRTAVLKELISFSAAEQTQDVFAGDGAVPLPTPIRDRVSQVAGTIE